LDLLLVRETRTIALTSIAVNRVVNAIILQEEFAGATASIIEFERGICHIKTEHKFEALPLIAYHGNICISGPIENSSNQLLFSISR
jgi:hypothetical protein